MIKRLIKAWRLLSSYKIGILPLSIPSLNCIFVIVNDIEELTVLYFINRADKNYYEFCITLERITLSALKDKRQWIKLMFVIGLDKVGVLFTCFG